MTVEQSSSECPATAAPMTAAMTPAVAPAVALSLHAAVVWPIERTIDRTFEWALDRTADPATESAPGSAPGSAFSSASDPTITRAIDAAKQRARQRRARIAWLLAGAALLPALRAQALDDRLEYRLHCSGCHGVDGRGLPANGIPDLNDAGRWVGTAAGRQYLVQVPGIAASGIDDALAARLLNWSLKTYSSERLPADFQPYTAAEVARDRFDMATDAGTRRLRLSQAAMQAPPTKSRNAP